MVTNKYSTLGKREEERREALKHDNYYSLKMESNIEPIHSKHWEKFLTSDTPTHGYIYSVKCLGDLNGKKVIDIGCGTGGFSILLAKLGAFVEGCDISPKAIEIAKMKAEINKVSDVVKFKVNSFYNLEYDSSSFDFAIGQNVLHHLQDKKDAVSPLHRILKKGGKAVFFEPFSGSRWLDRLRLLFPVAIQDVKKITWLDRLRLLFSSSVNDTEDRPLKYSDLNDFYNNFEITYREFHIFSRLDRIFQSQAIIHFLGMLDLFLLSRLPFFKKYARYIVIEMIKR